MNLSFLWALAFEYPVINSPFSLKRLYSFLHPHGGVYCREARPSQCRQNWLSQFSDFAKHCLIEYDENSLLTRDNFVKELIHVPVSCPASVPGKQWRWDGPGSWRAWPNILISATWGEELGCCTQIWATWDYPGSAYVLFLLDRVVPVGHVQPTRFLLLFSLVAYSPH